MPSKQLLLAILAVFGLLWMPAAAQARGESYVQDQYYLGAGGTPPSLAAFAADPNRYLRHEAAYTSLKKGFERAVGTTLSNQGFSQLLTSNRVRLTPCTGSINTSGITPQGAVSYARRACYSGENLIQVQKNDDWVTVASQGCFNLVRPYQQTLAPPEPPQKVCRLVAVDQGVVYQSAPRAWHVPGEHTDHSKCGPHIHLPDASGVIQNTIRSTALLQVCE